MFKGIKSFTLVELIIVVIIVGILASLGLTQYNLVVEKSRLAEAKIRLGTMRHLAYEYYLNGGALASIQDSDVDGYRSCTTNSYYQYFVGSSSSAYVRLQCLRCTSGGKVPNASRAYYFTLQFYPATGQSDWHCRYADDASSCFGLTDW
jgi:prepilin-type N-terminal cleavage/methylation domain-containing protein